MSLFAKPYYILDALWLKEQSGAQWLSGRVLDSRQGRRFEPHGHHCVLEQDTLILA